ncbi:DEAD/DEAH box helicase [Acinetobacter baumannii]|uniref:DEAD/DEAH box helicase n=1 Tax=Acinetobacter baumannii TaxID=470 RepID=UPI002702BBD3|nr:ATP-binding domain-containing protein [Acinetobacter baumannii]MDO7420137.1 ATP-binding domain-containing protein [Acinetobacter baumannii]MDV4330001.1 ATP-binding domain-containing protein [Acinetobacter baumannii]MDV4333445.1 ATP-binding domain-containing protein [Acinetobacter baumannii]HCA5044353.1 DEAD/DEAH box helicase [Acinetobacter baumannii]
MIDVIHGTTDKPVTSKQLQESVQTIKELDGTLYLGYPIIGTVDGAYEIDALLTSPQHGIIALILVEGNELPEDIVDIQDTCYAMLSAKLIQYKELVKRRQLDVDVRVLTFAPAVSNAQENLDDDNLVITQSSSLIEYLQNAQSDNSEKYKQIVSAIQAVSKVKVGKKRNPQQPNSKGAKLVKLDQSITNLDLQQSKAVLETVNGVQRIRGLAGSGKTIVLARKVAYLHAKNPEWKIAVTFNTRSLKKQFENLITSFVYEQTNELPDFDKIKIIHAWGSPSIEGIYYNATLASNAKYYDFRSAKIYRSHSDQSEFDFVCKALLDQQSSFPSLYDLILIDEAQDFSPSFLQLCYKLLDKNKRLIYAYDELQTLSESSMPNPEDIWGRDANGNPIVSLNSNDGEPERDIILDTCYRNPRPILTTAHALGFGVYRKVPEGKIPLVQMFDYAPLWNDIGYEVLEGSLSEGEYVRLARTTKSSPEFLENHSDIDDLIEFKTFQSEEEQIKYLVESIKKDIEEEELKPEDIMIIHPNALTARDKFGFARYSLYEVGINSNLAGVTISPDEFSQDDSVTFTSIYRAKGNEAPMVYVINADHCAQGIGLATKRNILFTAMTRTKAWLRVLGVGTGMQILEDEFNEVKRNNFSLSFRYPTEEQRKHLRIVNRDLSDKDKRKIQSRRKFLENLIKDVDEGVLHKEDLDPEVLKKFKDIFGL